MDEVLNSARSCFEFELQLFVIIVFKLKYFFWLKLDTIILGFVCDI